MLINAGLGLLVVLFFVGAWAFLAPVRGPAGYKDMMRAHDEEAGRQALIDEEIED